ncbi:MAG: universal stress protein [Dehalococcoidia bacterium]
MFSHVLVPLDQSTAAEGALLLAEEIARLTGARITLVTALTRLGVAESPELRKIDELAQQRAELYLRKCADRVRKSGVTEVHTEAQFGEPAEVITRLAGSAGADLIAISSHGMTGDRRYPLGSVALKVLTVAQCPVLVARA